MTIYDARTAPSLLRAYRSFGRTQSVSEFLESVSPLSVADKQRGIDQAIVLIEQLFAPAALENERRVVKALQSLSVNKPSWTNTQLLTARVARSDFSTESTPDGGDHRMAARHGRQVARFHCAVRGDRGGLFEKSTDHFARASEFHWATLLRSHPADHGCAMLQYDRCFLRRISRPQYRRNPRSPIE